MVKDFQKYSSCNQKVTKISSSFESESMYTSTVDQYYGLRLGVEASNKILWDYLLTDHWHDKSQLKKHDRN